MNGVWADIKTAGLPKPYRPYAVRDAAFKYNLCVHSATKTIPVVEWLAPDSIPTNIFIFGQISAVHNHGQQRKLGDCVRWAGYLYPEGAKHIMVLSEEGVIKRVLITYFVPENSKRDPIKSTDAMFNFTRAIHRAMKAQHTTQHQHNLNPAHSHQCRSRRAGSTWMVRNGLKPTTMNQIFSKTGKRASGMIYQLNHRGNQSHSPLDTVINGNLGSSQLNGRCDPSQAARKWFRTFIMTRCTSSHLSLTKRQCNCS